MNPLTRGRPSGPKRRSTRPGALVHARQLAGLSGAKAALILSRRRRCQVPAQTLYGWEQGKSRPPEWAVASLALLYGVSEGSLWEQNEPVRRKVVE